MVISPAAVEDLLLRITRNQLTNNLFFLHRNLIIAAVRKHVPVKQVCCILCPQIIHHSSKARSNFRRILMIDRHQNCCGRSWQSARISIKRLNRAAIKKAQQNSCPTPGKPERADEQQRDPNHLIDVEVVSAQGCIKQPCKAEGQCKTEDKSRSPAVPYPVAKRLIHGLPLREGGNGFSQTRPLAWQS